MGFKVNFTLNRSSTSFKSMNSKNCRIEKLYTMQKPKKKINLFLKYVRFIQLK